MTVPGCGGDLVWRAREKPIDQPAVDDDFRGRIFSLYEALFNVAFVGAAGVAALMLPSDGRSVSLLVTIAVIYGAIAVPMARFEHR